MQFITTYKAYNQPSPRSIFRHYALNALSLIKAPSAESLKQKRIVFTCFHSYFTDNEATLRAQLEFMGKHFKFISYSEGVRRLTTGEIDDNYICFSADDGYKNFLDACKVFDDYGIKALVFANPKVIGETNYETLKFYNDDRLSHGPMEFLSWQEVDDLLTRGHEVGNHTYGHRNVGNCSEEELQEQIVKSYEILQKHVGSDIHFAWPYGSPSDISQKALDLIYKTGHISAAAVDRHSHYTRLELVKERSYLIREQIEPFYPVNHVRYFLAKDHSVINR